MFIKILNYNLYLLDTKTWRVFSIRSNRYIGFERETGHVQIELREGSMKLNTSLHDLIYTIYHGEIPEGYVVHHIDGNPKNNNPNNLTAMPRNVHTILHCKGRKVSEHQYEKMSNTFFKPGHEPYMKGKKHSIETRQKMSEHHYLKGKKMSNEQRKNISEGLKNSDKVAARMKPVEMLKNGTVIREFKKQSDVEEFGFTRSLVCQCCQGTRKSHKGFQFRYKSADSDFDHAGIS